MANTQQLQKRTSTPGKRPGISDIQLGEIAINTYDGKMFIKQDRLGNIDIIQVGDDKVENVFYVAKGAIKGNLGTSLQDAFQTLDSAVSTVTSLHSFTFNRVKCKRDFGLIFDGLYHDIAFGTNYNAVTSGLSYQRASANVVRDAQLVATRSGFNEAKGAVASVAGVKSSEGFDGALQRNNRHWSEVVDILVNGQVSTDTAADTLIFPAPAVLPFGDADDAAVILQNNRAYLQNEAITYITANYPSLSYNEQKCRRDVSFIVDALTFDILYGGTHGVHIVAQSYFVDGVAQLPAAQQTQSVATYTHLGVIIDELVRNALSSNLTSTGLNSGGNGGQYASATEGTQLKNTLIPIFVDVIDDNNLDNLPAKVEPNYTSRGVSSELRTAIVETKELEDLIITQSVERAATTGDTTIYLKSGDYAINNPLKLPPKTAIVGDNLRTVTVRPQNVDSDLFYMDNGTFIKDVTFRDHQNLAACVSFDPSVDSPGAGPFIIQSPYVQNCTSITTDGVGMRIDGSKASGLRSMVSDAFTQYNAAGFGVQLLNRGYAQLVSMFTISTATSIEAKSGGQCSIANSNASFGDFGLVAEGSSPALYRGILDSAQGVFADVVRFSNVRNLDSYSYLDDLNAFKKPNYNDAIKFDSEDFYYTITNVDSVAPGVYDLTFQPPMNESKIAGQTVNFHQRSQITTSSHTFEYVGSGTNTFTAIPQNGGIPSRQREVVFDSATQEGLVVFTSTDQLGDFRIGADLTINRAAGRIEGETFERSLFEILTPYILALEG